ncbi:MFS transporter [Dactylosporangium sp. CA-092794]|uniref:MFS transporter n=1 Tax=Dactylosporangium sp. CA-092794 TaxID=3239929 RepID=UPI003D8DB0D4
MTGFGIVLPSLPYHVEHLGGSGAWVGLLLTAYAAAQFVAAPLLGSLSDQHGRRPVLLLTLAGSAVCMGLTAAAGSLAMLLAGRVLAGGCGGAIAVGQAYATDLVPPGRRTRALGLVGAAVGTGFIAGPALGAALTAAGIGFAGSCLAAAALALANCVLGWTLLPRGGPVPASSPPSGLRTRVRRLVRAARQPRLARILAAVFLGMCAFAGMETTLALLVLDRFGDGPGTLGLMLAAVGVAVAVTQATLVGRLSDRYGHRNTAAAGAATLGASLLALALAPDWLAYASLGAMAVGHGLLSTAAASLIAGSNRADVGGTLGIGQSAAAAARVVAPIAAGAAFDVGPALPYIGAAAACAAAATSLLLRHRPRPAATLDDQAQAARRSWRTGPAGTLTPTPPGPSASSP